MANGNDLSLPDVPQDLRNPLFPTPQPQAPGDAVKFTTYDGRHYGPRGRGEHMSPSQIYRLALRSGFPPEAARTMTAITEAESGGWTGAYNPHDAHGGSFGLVQVNGAHPGAQDVMYNPEASMRYAFQISKGGTDFTPWGSFTPNQQGVRTYQGFMSEATQAAQGVDPGEYRAAQYTPIPDVPAYQPLPMPTFMAPGQGMRSGLIAGSPTRAPTIPAGFGPYGPQLASAELPVTDFGSPVLGPTYEVGGVPFRPYQPAMTYPTVPNPMNDPNFQGPEWNLGATPTGPQFAAGGALPQAVAAQEAAGAAGGQFSFPSAATQPGFNDPASGAQMGGAGGPSGQAAGAGVMNPAQMPQISKSTMMFGALAALAAGYRPIRINYDPFSVYKQGLMEPSFPSSPVAAGMALTAHPSAEMQRTISQPPGTPVAPLSEQFWTNPFRKFIQQY